MTTVSLAVIFALSATAALLGSRLVQQGLIAQRHRRVVGRRLASFAGDPMYEPLAELDFLETAIRWLARLSLLISRDQEAQARLVRAAGRFDNVAVHRFLALRMALSSLGAVAALTCSATTGCSPIVAAALTAVLVSAGYGGPTYVLRYLASRRRKKISRELPLFLDSVKLLVQTGASLELALRQVTRIETAAIPELRRTLETLLQDLDQGKSYDLALERWAERAAVPGAMEFAGLALQSIKHGSELSPMLEQFIADLIEQRLAMARELAGKRSVSMTVVMVAFFLPPLMAIVGAPAVVDIVRNLLH